jgi:aerobic-type carbon monoxide dehydrogenase small subunit (CoxS/CutS family)
MQFTVNGKKVNVRAYPMKRLLDVLREDLGLTGTKEGCGEGECGACTVLINGEAVCSCLVPLAQVKGARVKTIEGVKHPIQEAFVREGGTQCGICTPGFIMSALTLPANVSLKEMQERLAGNLCRCTGYMGIYRAVKKGLKAKRGAKLVSLRVKKKSQKRKRVRSI